MRRWLGLGLRAQILLGLSVVFVASFPLLVLAPVQLTQRARLGDRLESARVAARVTAAGLEALGPMAAQERFDAVTAPLMSEGAIAGVELLEGGRPVQARGAVGAGVAVVAPVAPGTDLRLWVEPPGADTGGAVTRLLLLYLAVTGGGILLLAYVALTYLIVRPVERVTRAAERLASGAAVKAPVAGAAEVARLADAFNDMAAQLRGERLALEERLRELERTTADLRSAQDQVVRTARLASVGRLSAGVAHEIGNPLAAIVGLVELLREGDVPDAERVELLARIQSEAERIHRIIRELLDFARPADEEGEQPCADPAQVVRDALALVAPQKDLQHVSIEHRMAEHVPPVRMASGRLTQVVLNLLLNAADAVEGRGTITVELGLDAEDASRVLLAVHDTGPGVAPAVREHLFEPFVTTKPAGEGTGLGLAVCHTLVERAGGSIALGTAPEGGARFDVRLPIASAPA
jgi:two-component system, NtrC family, sensor kinase